MPTSESTSLVARQSRLGTLPDDLLEEVFSDATEVHLTPPGILHAEGGPPFTGLVTEGLVRVVPVLCAREVFREGELGLCCAGSRQGLHAVVAV